MSGFSSGFRTWHRVAGALAGALTVVLPALTAAPTTAAPTARAQSAPSRPGPVQSRPAAQPYPAMFAPAITEAAPAPSAEPASAMSSPAPGGLPANAHVRETPHFLFYYAPQKVIDVESVQLSAESAFRNIESHLGYTPPGRIPVVIYADRNEFKRNSHVSRTEFVVGTASSADDAIRLDGSQFLESADKVVGHEVAHIFLFRMLGPTVEEMPLWMNEGLAQELGGADPRNARRGVEDALYEDRLLPLNALSREFPPGAEAGLAYDEAQQAVGDLLRIGGWAKMRDMLQGLKAGQPFATALQNVYGFTPAEWDRQWLASLRVEARKHAWMQVASWVVPFLMFIALAWGVLTVRKHRRQQIADEAEPASDLEPPSWWREDEFRL